MASGIEFAGGVNSFGPSTLTLETANYVIVRGFELRCYDNGFAGFPSGANVAIQDGSGNTMFTCSFVILVTKGTDIIRPIRTRLISPNAAAGLKVVISNGLGAAPQYIVLGTIFYERNAT